MYSEYETEIEKYNTKFTISNITVLNSNSNNTALLIWMYKVNQQFEGKMISSMNDVETKRDKRVL